MSDSKRRVALVSCAKQEASDRGCRCRLGDCILGSALGFGRQRGGRDFPRRSRSTREPVFKHDPEAGCMSADGPNS